MSKFKIIDGQNVTSIVNNNREIVQLELELRKKHDATDRDLVVYAYHFVRLGHLLLAQKYLNRLSTDYFDVNVYKDLSKALLAWSVVKADEKQDSRHVQATYEYFIILKRVLEMFEDVNFTTKPAFYRFRKQWKEFTTIPHVK